MPACRVANRNFERLTAARHPAEFRVDAATHDRGAGARGRQVHIEVLVAVPPGRNYDPGVHPAAENRKFKPPLVGVIANLKMFIGYQRSGKRAALTRVCSIEEANLE